MIKRRRPASTLTTREASSVRPGPATGSSPLADVRSFAIPVGLLEATLEVFREAGRDGCEAFVVWGATVAAGVAEFVTMLVPAQVGHQGPDGLLVTVEGEALFKINKMLYERGEILAAQVHSHPTDAFHSETDDCFSLVTLTGSLSLVIPDFGRNGIGGRDGWAWFRLVGQGEWAPLGSDDRVAIVGQVA